MTLLQAKSPEHDSYSLPSREGEKWHPIDTGDRMGVPLQGYGQEKSDKVALLQSLQKLLDNAVKDLMETIGTWH